MGADDVMRVIYFPEGKKPQIERLDRGDPENLEAMQALVDGYVEMMRLKEGLALFCNEDAIHLEMEPNRLVPPSLSGWFDPWRSTIRGPFYVSTQDETDLTDAQIKYILHAFGETLEVSGEVVQGGVG